MLECKIIGIADGCKKKFDLKKYPITTVREFYNWDKLVDGLELTPKQAVKINLGEITARNAFYFANSDFLRKYIYHRVRSRHNYSDFIKEDYDDILQQVYLDLPYYNFTNEKTFFSSLRATERLTPYGGLINIREYYRAVKISNTISLYHESRYRKSGEKFYLLDVIADNMPSPEDLAIRTEEHADEKADENYYKFEQILKQEIIKHSNCSKAAKQRLLAAIL